MMLLSVDPLSHTEIVVGEREPDRAAPETGRRARILWTGLIGSTVEK